METPFSLCGLIIIGHLVWCVPSIHYEKRGEKGEEGTGEEERGGKERGGGEGG